MRRSELFVRMREAWPGVADARKLAPLQVLVKPELCFSGAHSTAGNTAERD